MKKIFLTLLALILIASYCQASMYLIYDKDTKVVYSMSSKDDTVIPAGKELVQLEGEWHNYDFDKNPCEYKFIEGDFILDVGGISARELAVVELQEKAAEELLITNKMKLLAKVELEKEGKTFKHIKDKDFE